MVDDRDYCGDFDRDDRVGTCTCGESVYRVCVHRGRGACDAVPYGEDDEYALKCSTCGVVEESDLVEEE
jgi:hypothetical protein